MIIGIDGNEANVNHRVGIGEYASELLLQFAKYQISNIKYQIYLKDRPREDLPKERDGWRYRVIGPSKLWTQIGLPFDLYFHKPRPDVFFSTTHYAPRFSPAPTVISIMDLSYIHYPEMFRPIDLYQLRNWGSYSIKNAKKILTISEASRDDIIKEYGVSEDKIIVTYPGVKKFSIFNFQFSMKSQYSNFKKIKEKYGIEGEYILFVGTLQPRKNIIRLIQAFAEVKSNDLELVIVGKRGWMYEEILRAPEKYKIEDKVKFLDYVSDEDLPLFYQNALCFVLPSLYEGFGLPVLEAMQYGCPVITSNVSSLPEAGGDAAIYIDPKDANDITEKIRMVIGDKNLRKEMIEKGYKQAARFSWEKSAKETLSVLTEVANNG
jgi:glycosyltransferase involved in cell wall biosynthesis